MSETIPVTLPDAVAADVAAFSAIDGMSAEDLILHAVETYVSNRRFHDLRKRIRAQAAANGFHTDEDVFQAVS
jgi:hypothetical protein